MSTTRIPLPSIVHSALSALACALLLASAAPADARQLGGVSVISNGPWERNPTGGYTVCTAHLRKANPSGNPDWVFHTVSGNSTAACMAQVSLMGSAGWSPNPNPGWPLCGCTGGFHGFMTVTGNAGGPAGEAPLSPNGQAVYHEGLQQLRDRYRIEEFAHEHDIMLDQIRATEPPQE